MDPTKGSVWPQVDLANGERHAACVPPMCDMFGLDSSGVIRWANLTEDYRVRARPDQLIKQARDLN